MKRIIGSAIVIVLVTLTLAGGYFYFKQPHVNLQASSFAALPNWQQDNFVQALQTFQQSCKEILKRDSNANFGQLAQAGKVRQWQTICNAANKLTQPTQKQAQTFFETWFTPYSVKNNFSAQGLFTGYYLPLLTGSLKKDKTNNVPIYGLPTDLVKVSLGLFRPEFANKSIIGQVKNGSVIPYPDHAAIQKGALKGKAPIIAWSNSAIDLFFAQIQGSAILELPNKKKIILSYASGNGRPYTPIGKFLLEKHALTKQTISMQSIRAWLQQHPDQVNTILTKNASYVFFKLGTAVVGSETVPLTAERSLAVDTRTIPLGAPLWLDTTLPLATTATPFQHLLIAQDTGGAIKGIVRGDIYFGASNNAEEKAGKMKNSGRYWLLLPR